MPNVVLKVVSNPIQALDFLKRRNAFTSAQYPHIIIIGSGCGKSEQLNMLKEIKEDASIKTISTNLCGVYEPAKFSPNS